MLYNHNFISGIANTIFQPKLYSHDASMIQFTSVFNTHINSLIIIQFINFRAFKPHIIHNLTCSWLIIFIYPLIRSASIPKEKTIKLSNIPNFTLI